MELKDVKAIVTGAAGGMGFYFAQQIAAAGGQVCAGDVNEEGLKQHGPGVFTRKLDVSSRVHAAVLATENGLL